MERGYIISILMLGILSCWFGLLGVLALILQGDFAIAIPFAIVSCILGAMGYSIYVNNKDETDYLKLPPIDQEGEKQ